MRPRLNLWLLIYNNVVNLNLKKNISSNILKLVDPFQYSLIITQMLFCLLCLMCISKREFFMLHITGEVISIGVRSVEETAARARESENKGGIKGSAERTRDTK